MNNSNGLKVKSLCGIITVYNKEKIHMHWKIKQWKKSWLKMYRFFYKEFV
jgi:hypothetical protein